MKVTKLLILGSLLGAAMNCTADESTGWAYGSNGWQWSNPGTGSYLWLGLRFQSRYSSREDDPLVSDDLRQEGHEGLSMNRARYKIGGGIGRKFTFYHEYDLRNGQLLDLRATWKPATWLNLRVGQWKAEFNRERIDSSGKQQFVERSIATYWFTVDRQNGVMASGRLAAGLAADSSWWLGVLNGNGLNTGGDGSQPMWLARYQWNFSGRVLPFSQSALKRYPESRGSLAFAVVSNASRYTRFSSSGGGQLPGFEEGEDNQYRVEQILQEYAWQKGGWSIQQEFHFKKITDRFNGRSVNVTGAYLNVGWFPSSHFENWPAPLELAARFALVNPYAEAELHENREFTLAANWFFNGHRNKLTTDISRLQIDDPQGQARDWRFRLQWDISL
ncbi:MAG: porin [Xanthomonadales bacterium]|nr:porin [Xanthomonadales bacterium]